MASTIGSERILGDQTCGMDQGCLNSRISCGSLFGSQKSIQTLYGSVAKTQLISQSFSDWFWNVLDTNSEALIYIGGY